MRTTDRETNREVNRNTGQIADEPAVRTKWITPLAITTIVLGFCAIVFPFFATITSTLFFGWVFIFAGIAQMIYAFQSKGVGQVIWKIVLGLLYFAAGIFVLANPIEGAIAFTLILGITILIQGIIQTSMSFQMRRTSRQWGWMLASGLVGIVFGIYVWASVPITAPWLIGTLIGVNLLFDGAWMLTLQPKRRRA